VKLSSQTSVLLAKVAFLLIMIAGIWLVFAETLHSGWRVIVVGILLAIAGLLLMSLRIGASSASPLGRRT
jgi:hypothetical protein